jgi:hypothetical protein
MLYFSGYAYVQHDGLSAVHDLDFCDYRRGNVRWDNSAAKATVMDARPAVRPLLANAPGLRPFLPPLRKQAVTIKNARRSSSSHVSRLHVSEFKLSTRAEQNQSHFSHRTFQTAPDSSSPSCNPALY